MMRLSWNRGLCAIVFAALPLAVVPGAQSPPRSDIAALLERQTGELMDAVSAGNPAPWQRYLMDDVLYTSEDGILKSKHDLLTEIRPFPKDTSGTLRVTRFRAVLHGPTAIANYVADEEEHYFGQTIHARYLTTDTWIETPSGWHLAASHVLALRDDPPAHALPAARLDEYVGTYELSAGVTYTISRDGNSLVGQRSGRAKEPLRVEVADSLFVPGQPRLRKIFERGADGRVTGFVERRETWDIAWRRIR
jgi:hypothetical protein